MTGLKKHKETLNRRSDNTMAKIKGKNGQIIIYTEN